MHLGSITPQITLKSSAFLTRHVDGCIFYLRVEIFGGGPALAATVTFSWQTVTTNCRYSIRVHATVNRNKSGVLLIVNSSSDDGPTAASDI